MVAPSVEFVERTGRQPCSFRVRDRVGPFGDQSGANGRQALSGLAATFRLYTEHLAHYVFQFRAGNLHQAHQN